MIRLGLFTVLYTVPAASVVACLFYEQHNRPRWEATHNCPCLRDQQPDQARRPDYAVFMLKYFMCLVVGITSGVWVWSGKTLESWRALCTRCCWASKGAAVAGGTGAGAGGEAEQVGRQQSLRQEDLVLEAVAPSTAMSAPA
ncbi:PREDICTED: frizzled-8 [Chlamydotis macqueenii]|uniref:frizzled-8 n=1 Tax=Chlamydotis macqueenii TaxID=187382 RepID=UPI000529DDAE|nr:PREDICTED: frizzled-8 [Chlamydotis macqueenii]